MATLQQILEATGYGRMRPDQDPRLMQQPVPQQYTVPAPPPTRMINRNAGVGDNNTSRTTLPPSAPTPGAENTVQLLSRLLNDITTPTPSRTIDRNKGVVSDDSTTRKTVPPSNPDPNAENTTQKLNRWANEFNTPTPSRIIDRNKGVAKDDSFTRKTLPPSSGEDKYDSAERIADYAAGIPGRAANAPYDIAPPGLNPANAAWWFAKRMFGTPMGGPPGKTSAPPPIGEQTFEGSPAPSTPAPPPIGQQLSGGKPDGESGGSAATPRGSSAPSSPGQMAPTPSGSPSGNNDLAKFMLQMGLSLMVPRWGGPLANIGMAAGEGAEAVGRAKKEEQETAMGQKKLELEQARVDRMGSGRRATESSRSKRVKEKKPLEAFGENLSPEATLYFQQRLKNLKGESEVTNPDGTTATLSEADQYNAILRETKVIDARSRAARGMARSDEIPEDKLRQHVGTPNEIAIMNTVAGDPVQRAILMQRIENIKRAKAATNANTPAAAKPK